MRMKPFEIKCRDAGKLVLRSVDINIFSKNMKKLGSSFFYKIFFMFLNIRKSEFFDYLYCFFKCCDVCDRWRPCFKLFRKFGKCSFFYFHLFNHLSSVLKWKHFLKSLFFTPQYSGAFWPKHLVS